MDNLAMGDGVDTMEEDKSLCSGSRYFKEMFERFFQCIIHSVLLVKKTLD